MPVMETSAAYASTQARISELVADLRPEQAAITVGACPEWTVHNLISHVVSLPAAILSGDLPDGDNDAWIKGLVDGRADTPLAEQLTEWSELAVGPLVDGGAALLFHDLVVHEHDLRTAIDQPGERQRPEVTEVMTGYLQSFAKPLQEAGHGSIAVRHGDQTWQSHDADPTWTLLVEPFEALRVLSSRRTADEVLALPHEGTPLVDVLVDHSPLPEASLGE